MKRSSLIGAVALLAACAVSQSASAQQFGAIHSRKDGHGVFDSYHHHFQANFLTVNLSSGGNMTINTWHSTIRGTWRNDGDRDELNIDSIKGQGDETDRASGNGYISLDRNGDWTHVVLNGRNDSDRSPIALDFTPFGHRSGHSFRTRNTHQSHHKPTPWWKKQTHRNSSYQTHQPG